MPDIQQLLGLAQKGMQTPQGQSMMQQALQTMGPQIMQQVMAMLGGGGGQMGGQPQGMGPNSMQQPGPQGMGQPQMMPMQGAPATDGELEGMADHNQEYNPDAPDMVEPPSGPSQPPGVVPGDEGSPDEAMLAMIAEMIGGGQTAATTGDRVQGGNLREMRKPPNGRKKEQYDADREDEDDDA